METKDNSDDESDKQKAAGIFRNLIPCSTYDLPFVDRYAQFAVVFENGKPLGIGMIQVRSAYSTFQVAYPGLSLWLDDEGQMLPVQRLKSESLPWCVTEKGRILSSGFHVDVEVRHVYLDEVSMLSEFVFRNSGSSSAKIKPLWQGQISGDRWRGSKEYLRYGFQDEPVLRETWAEADGQRVRGGLRSKGGGVVMPLPSIEIGCESSSGMVTAVSDKNFWTDLCIGRKKLGGLFGRSLFYAFKCKTLELEPGEERKFMFSCELSVASYLDENFHFRKLNPGKIDMDGAIDDSRSAFEKRVSLRNPPACKPVMEQKLWRARWALLRTGYRGRGKAGEYGQSLASTCVPSCNGFTRIFFWDSLFSAVALSKFEPEFARGAIKSVFSRQTADGHCPEHSYNYHLPARDVIGAPQAPVASWAVKNYLNDHPEDKRFLDEIYPMLIRNHSYWNVHGDKDKDGLAEWTWTGQTADNSPLYDEYHTGKECGWLPPVASVHLNSFLYQDALQLAEFSEMRGLKREAGAYREEAGRRAAALSRVRYVADEMRYWDFNHATGRHRRLKTFYMFWPIWAGMPVPPKTRKDLIENVLLDPGQFFGETPFPSVAYDEPSYEPKGYWRGRTWPHISYWLLEMLCREGYADAADQAAKRLISSWAKEATFTENLASDASMQDAAGVPDYNWGVAAFYLFATRAYSGAVLKGKK